MRRTFSGGLVASTLLLALCANRVARAAEGGIGVYLLGAKAVTGVAITPPAGVYFQNDTYFYDGKLNGNKTLPTGGLLVGSVSSQTWLNLSSPIWITPVKLLGGSLGFSATVPVGTPRIDATLQVNSPIFGPIGRSVTDANFNLSDLYLSSFVGWNAGHFHWQIGISGIIPSGTYTPGQLSNASLNRSAIDAFGSFTWFDPQQGLDLSAALGFTFNQANSATDYKTGDEFHLEWAATKYLTKEFTVGLVGYYYQQFTADSGTGARLGSFEGRATALGGAIGYTFQSGQLPISTRLKIFREFNVVNRQEGTAGYFTVSLPLAIVTSTR